MRRACRGEEGKVFKPVFCSTCYVLLRWKGSQNVCKSSRGAASAGPWQRGEPLVSEKARSSNGPWEARGCKFSSVIVRLRVGEAGKLKCHQQKALWVRASWQI